MARMLYFPSNWLLGSRDGDAHSLVAPGLGIADRPAIRNSTPINSSWRFVCSHSSSLTLSLLTSQAFRKETSRLNLGYIWHVHHNRVCTTDIHLLEQNTNSAWGFHHVLFIRWGQLFWGIYNARWFNVYLRKYLIIRFLDSRPPSFPTPYPTPPPHNISCQVVPMLNHQITVFANCKSLDRSQKWKLENTAPIKFKGKAFYFNPECSTLGCGGRDMGVIN